METKEQPAVFYSFRRCPYCIRAHMALAYSGQKFVLRSVLLKNLPEEVLNCSPDKTVPVMVYPDGSVSYHSWDIMKKALHECDDWLGKEGEYLSHAEKLVKRNDSFFKYYLDLYKYADRYPDYSEKYYREKCEIFLIELTDLLEKNSQLLAKTVTVADIAIFPYVRQFAMVDPDWFTGSSYTLLAQWLDYHLDSELFKQAFQKHDIWESQ